MGWEDGGRFKWEGMHVYLWLIHMLYGRNQHNIVRQSSFKNKNIYIFKSHILHYFFKLNKTDHLS